LSPPATRDTDGIPILSTTHGRLSPQARAESGVVEGLLRVAAGLESVKDLPEDLARGLG
jgi:O-succinylhomoserine sulfhydrylase